MKYKSQMSDVSSCIQRVKSLRCIVIGCLLKNGNFQSHSLFFVQCFVFSGRAPRAGLEALASRIRPAGRSLETPGVEGKQDGDICRRDRESGRLQGRAQNFTDASLQSKVQTRA